MEEIVKNPEPIVITIIPIIPIVDEWDNYGDHNIF